MNVYASSPQGAVTSYRDTRTRVVDDGVESGRGEKSLWRALA